MGTLKSWKRAYGVIKDSTKVGLAQINSDFADLDVAIVKATNHVECPPKERHVRKILLATSAVRPRADVAYCIHALSRRLAKTRNWTVALKTLIVIHRLLRDGDPTFREELLNFSQRGRLLQLSNFKDESSPIAWDCSGWVRTYGMFLEERLECFKTLKYDIEAERLVKPMAGQERSFSRTRDMESEELLLQLPALQQLLYRLVGCKPEGAAVGNYLIQYALALVLKESFKIYCAINDGIINLLDMFFEMPRHEAVSALEAYKRASQQSGSLSDFYDVCKGLELARNFQFPALREPPQSFLSTMEDYVKEAPRAVSVPSEQPLLLTYMLEEENSSETYVPVTEPEAPTPVSDVPVPTPVVIATPINQAPTNTDTVDLLGLSFTSPEVAAMEERNALALAIVPVAKDAAPTSTPKDFDPTGWELALVDTPSTNMPQSKERQLAGGLDSLTLNSLYDEGSYRNSLLPVYGAPAPNPFAMRDPFAVSHNIPPSAVVQMGPINQQQVNPFESYRSNYSQLQNPHLMANPANPFGDSGLGAFPANYPPHSQVHNPFGSTNIM